MGFQKKDKDDDIEGRTFHRRRACRFCSEKEAKVDYKNRWLLQPYLTERFKIVPRRISGTCTKHQRELSVAIKRARHIAVVPYSTTQHV